MKTKIRILCCLLLPLMVWGSLVPPPQSIVAADGDWTWISGSNTINQGGTYGTKGTPAASNVPGARQNSISWIDASGNLWLFGGYGFITSTLGRLNDLWRYDVSTGYWTWISGSNTVNQGGTYGPAASNVPGARSGSISWIDASGNLWLFGGLGYDTSTTLGWLNDLWAYDESWGYWVWISGSNTINQRGTYGTKGTPTANNVPGARSGSISWIDASGNLWLFGGLGYNSSWSGSLNDLWRYDVSTGYWTWMAGNSTINQVGTYGTKGTPTASNVPGARRQSISWIDASGDLWLFGGSGYDTSTSGQLNDLWRYDVSMGYWTWMAGDNTVNQLGIYGAQGTPAASNVPGARAESISWIDASGNLWLFGGYGNDTSTFGRLNDLWRYDVSTGYWTWISGSNTANQVGTYGAQGTPAASNVPGARQQSISWIDASGDLWLFGGGGYSASPGAGALNDLWWYDNPLIVPEFEPVAPILLISVFLVLILIHKRRRPLET